MVMLSVRARNSRAIADSPRRSRALIRSQFVLSHVGPRHICPRSKAFSLIAVEGTGKLVQKVFSSVK